MLMFAFAVILLAYFLATKFFLKALPERLFILVFTVSTVYYGILGPWYWGEFRDSTFFGVDWSSQLPMVVFMFVMVYLIVVGTFSLMVQRTGHIYFAKSAGDVSKLMPTLNLLLGIGFVSCGYVYLIGGELLERDALVTDDALLNIALQLSDLIIGALLFWAATKGFEKKWFVFLSIFVIYAVVVGFRSKLVLLLGPLLIFVFCLPGKNQLLVRGTIIIAGALVAVLFSIMTITRVKFSGLNLDLLSDAGMEEYLNGFFAETNLIFGLSSCLRIFGNTVPFAGLEPFIDVLVQFVPRFIYPEKNLYQHLKQTAWWIGNSLESQSSGTAMPFFGEYYAAFGWIGVILLVVLYAIVTLYLIKLIRRFSVTKSQYLMGAALIAVYIGYYYFSRGSIAQIFKGLIFVCGPFFYLIHFNFSRFVVIEMNARDGEDVLKNVSNLTLKGHK